MERVLLAQDQAALKIALNRDRFGQAIAHSQVLAQELSYFRACHFQAMYFQNGLLYLLRLKIGVLDAKRVSTVSSIADS